MRKLLLTMLLPALLGTWHGGKAQYCTAGPTSTFDTNIEGVWLSGETYSITDSTGCPGVTDVRDFTATDSADVEQGFTYTLEVVMGRCGTTGYASVAEVWIDWDQDGDFDSGESIGTWSGTPRDTVAFTFTAPMTSALGKTRMRVMLHEGGTLPLNPCNSYSWGAVHDYTIEVTGIPPACPFPTQLSASGVADNEATISWTGTGSDYIVEYGPEGFTPGMGTTVNVTANSATLTNLAGNTTYDVYVTNDCSSSNNGLSAASGPISFTTLCAPVSSFTESFEAYAHLDTDVDCWAFLAPGNFSWIRVEEPTSTAAVQAYDGVNLLRMYNSSNTTVPLIAFGPNVDNLDSDTMQIRFYAAQTGGTGAVEMYVGVSKDNLSDTSVMYIDTVSIAGDAWQEFEIEMLNIPAGYKHIVFQHAHSASFVYINIDDVHYEPIPACPVSTDFNLVSVTSDEGTFGWTAGGGVAWRLEWGPVGFQPGTGDSITTTQNPYTVTGLNPNTTYDIYLRDTCADGSLSRWIGPITFTTKCLSQSMPFVETFDTWPPACFDLSGGTREWNQYTDAGNVNFAEAEFWSWTSGNNAMMTTPPIDITAAAQLKFLWSRNQGGTTYQDRMIIRARELGTASWDTLWDKTGSDLSTGTGANTEPGSQSQEIIYLPAGYVGQEMEFQYLAVSAYGPNFYMEELVVEATPPCIDPSGVTFSNTDGFSTDVNWNITGAYEHFYIEWGPQGYVPGTGGATIGSDTTSNLTYFIDTLTPSTCYDVYIRTICLGNDSSALAGPFNFCTTVSCPAPDDLTLNSVGTTNAQIGWNSAGTDWNIIIGPQGTTPGTGTVVYNVTDTFYDATSLTPATAYSFWVRDSCGVGDVSTWEGPFDFVTNCVPFSLNYHEDFSTWAGTDLPCWNLTGGTFNWVRYQSDDVVVAEFWSNNTPNQALMTSPEVDISQPAIIRFDWSKLYSASYPDDTLIVEVRDVTTSNWVQLLMLTDTAFNSNDGAASTSPGTFVQDTLVLDSLTWTSKTIQVRFRAHSGWGPNLFIKNVHIDADPTYLSCPPPVNLSSSAISEDEATITWQGSATGDYELEYGPTPTSPGQGTLVPVTGNTHTLTGLSSQTHYDVYVREICSPGDTSLWSGKHSFRTECSIFNLPFLEPFDSWNTDDEVDCWDFTGGTRTWFESTSGPYAEANFWGWTSGNDALLTSPLIELSSVGHLVFKWSHTYSASYPDDSLAVMVKAANATSWDVVWARGGANLESNDGAGNTTPGSFVTDSVALDSSLIGETIQVRFHAVSGYGPRLYLDSVQIVCELPELGYAANLQQLTFTDAEWNFDASASLYGNDYIWIIDNDTLIGQNVNYTFSSNGSQSITLVVSNDCSSVDSTFTIEVEGIDVETNVLEQSFNVYPNPTENRATVQFEVVAGRSAEIAVYNAVGQKVYFHDLGRVSGTVQHSMDVSNLAQGVYFVKLLTDIGTVETRLVIQR